MSQSITECFRVLQSVRECYKVLQSVTGCYRVLQNVTECNRMLLIVTECYRVLQSNTKTNLAHLLGPIFGLVNVVPLNFRRVLEMDQERERVRSAYEGLRVHHTAPPQSQ